MPFICKDHFEAHIKKHHKDDDLHVQAISNPEEAAHVAALKLVMNTHLREKLSLKNAETVNHNEYLKTIIDQKNISIAQKIIWEHYHSATHARFLA